MKAIWADRFPDCPPVSYLFKHRLADRWLRVYSLPDGKRYPEDETEWREVLVRYNALLTEMVGSSSPVRIVRSVFDVDDQVKFHNSLNDFDFKQFDRISKNDFDPDDNGEEIFLNCFYAESLFEPGKFDELLGAVADDAVSGLFIYDTATNRIFAPYDGGSDLILESREIRNEYSKIFADWASPRADGL